MSFMSDTAAPAHPAMLEAMARVNTGAAASYGADAETARAHALLADAFETDVAVWLTASGTAANALALATLCPPTGAVACHEMAHIEHDERGAPGFFTGGASLRLLPGARGRIDQDALGAALARQDRGFVHETPIDVVSLTHLTELGAAYSPDAIAAVAAQAHAAGCRVHLDGARLSNAVVGARTALADVTWRAGVDVVTFGQTKNGALGCEAIVLFGAARDRLDDLRARAKRAGHMPPKMRFLAAQMTAALKDDLWRTLAERANAAAQRLADGLAATPGVALAHQDDAPGARLDGNELFVRLPAEVAARMRAAGAAFYDWPDGTARFVTSWATTAEEVDAAIQAAAAVDAPI